MSGKNDRLHESVLQKGLTSWTELALLVINFLNKYERELQSSSPKHKQEIKLFSCNPEGCHST